MDGDGARLVMPDLTQRMQGGGPRRSLWHRGGRVRTDGDGEKGGGSGVIHYFGFRKDAGEITEGSGVDVVLTGVLVFRQSAGAPELIVVAALSSGHGFTGVHGDLPQVSSDRSLPVSATGRNAPSPGGYEKTAKIIETEDEAAFEALKEEYSQENLFKRLQHRMWGKNN